MLSPETRRMENRPLRHLLVRAGLAMVVLAAVGCGNRLVDQDIQSREVGRFMRGTKDCVKGGRFPVYTLTQTEEIPPEGLTIRSYFSPSGSYEEEDYFNETIRPFTDPRVYDLVEEPVDKDNQLFVIEVVTGYAMGESTEAVKSRLVLRELVARCPYKI